MVIDNLNVSRVSGIEAKTDAPLIVDANAPLPVTVSREPLQPVAGRNAQIFHHCCLVKYRQLSHRACRNVGKARYTATVEQAFGVGAMEVCNHEQILARRVSIVKRYYLLARSSLPAWAGSSIRFLAIQNIDCNSFHVGNTISVNISQFILGLVTKI